MKNKIIFWTSTSFIFLFEGVLPALTSHTEMARQGIAHLGYPVYFGMLLAVFKIAGTIILMVPQFPRRLKEWAYAGFTFDFIFASLSYWAVEGFGFGVIFPMIILAILAASYVYGDKISKERKLVPAF